MRAERSPDKEAAATKKARDLVDLMDERARENGASETNEQTVREPRPRHDGVPDQSRAFVKKAREIEADETKSDAEALIERLAKTPPKPRTRSRIEAWIPQRPTQC